jgi:hypothetical protein
MTIKIIKQQRDRIFNMGNPPNTRRKNHGRQPVRTSTISGFDYNGLWQLTRDVRMNQSPIAPSEVGLSLGRHNLDHNSIEADQELV